MFRIHKEQKIISVKDKLLPVFQHGFLRSAENIDLHILSDTVWENVNLHNINTVVTCAVVKYSYAMVFLMTTVIVGR